MKVHYKGLYAGTFDAMAKIDNQVTLIDFKTTFKGPYRVLNLTA